MTKKKISSLGNGAPGKNVYTDDLVSNPSDWVNKDQSYSDTVKGEKTLNQPIFFYKTSLSGKVGPEPIC